VGKDATNDIVPGTGFTELGDVSVGTPNQNIGSFWKNSNDTSVDATFTGSGGDAYGAIAAEIAFQEEAQGAFLLTMI